ncbi:hypothetical protein RchiOBHm_Chr2g0145441 [Rosa chinensis]|uniref:Uncharacterized protein n=1 Tax=Rosa chinensis TaxID=74649 RepID=A0A2P6RYP5_ROSCH|nr:hypothetical protein RchiOBHm_Chr2g0145441 [Rosa chinensis]
MLTFCLQKSSFLYLFFSVHCSSRTIGFFHVGVSKILWYLTAHIFCSETYFSSMQAVHDICKL